MDPKHFYYYFKIKVILMSYENMLNNEKAIHFVLKI